MLSTCAAAAAAAVAQHAGNAEQGDEYGLVLSADGGKMTFYIRSPLAEKLPLLLAGGSPPDQLVQQLQPLEELTAAGTSGHDADQQQQPQGIVVKADVMSVCLIEPVADGAAVISEEELQAKVSWGGARSEGHRDKADRSRSEGKHPLTLCAR